jgi:hypothetical protein
LTYILLTCNLFPLLHNNSGLSVQSGPRSPFLCIGIEFYSLCFTSSNLKHFSIRHFTDDAYIYSSKFKSMWITKGNHQGVCHQINRSVFRSLRQQYSHAVSHCSLVSAVLCFTQKYSKVLLKGYVHSQAQTFKIFQFNGPK